MGKETQRRARAKLVLTEAPLFCGEVAMASHLPLTVNQCHLRPQSLKPQRHLCEGRPSPSPDHLPGIAEAETTPSEGPRHTDLGSAIFDLHKYRRASVSSFCKVGIMIALFKGCGDVVHWWPAEEVPVCLWVEMLQLIPCPIAEACQTSEDYFTGLREGTCLEHAQGAG